LQRQLAEIRDLGWAGSVGEVEAEMGGIAAPIRDRGGYVVAVVGIEGSVDRVCDERLRPRAALVTHVMRAGRSISRELGHGRDW
jgi:DNA-binding IclR family transcriptional regulator